jgi:adenylate cyclase
LWFLGKPDQALEEVQKALVLAREFSEPHGLAHALMFAAILYQFRRESRLSREHVEAALAISNEHGLVMYRSQALTILGWTFIEQGRPKEAIEQIRQGLVARNVTGTELLTPHFFALLAEALGEAGQAEEGLQVLEEALKFADRSGDRCHLAEVYRLKGELLLKQIADRPVSRAAAVGGSGDTSDRAAQVEACFDQSIRIASEQGALSWELRSATSLARLYQSQGKQKEAHKLLATIYDRFTEGFDTIDCLEAKALLDELR